MKVRFFGTSSCVDCLEAFIILNKFDIDYDYINANDEREEIQSLCDDNNVDLLPHIQVIEDDGTVIRELTGKITEDDMCTLLI